MNFYLRYPGDYQRDTAHLSILEHGVFGLMLDQYYGSEKPLPKGKSLYRLLRVETAAEKKAVASVVSQFWTETSEGLINKRAHAEIEKQCITRARLQRLHESHSYRQHREFVLRRDGYECAYCGASDTPLQLDHIVPQSKGGTDDPENLTPACLPCNVRKGDKLLEEWFCYVQ